MSNDQGRDLAAEIDLEGLSAEEAVTQLIQFSAMLPASDLFFISNATTVTVRARYLGTYQQIGVVPRHEGVRYINHIKACAEMDVAQRMRPLDGRWVVELENGEMVDLRINMIPTLYGEDLSIRLFRHDGGLFNVQELGFDRKSLDQLLSLLARPSGLILVTGPSGAGKTTTLYACLEFLNDGKRKINTIEDPIEYELEGVRQSQINPKIDLGFAELLTGVLRQSPDIIMVGEIRDPETAKTAVRAANSGHLVFATLHAPAAAGAIDAMYGLGVLPHFLATSLVGVVSQRLVRTLCDDCKLGFDMTGAPNTFDDVRQWLSRGEGEQIYSAPGCPLCYHTGYTGRTGVLEVLRITRELRQMIFEQSGPRDLRDRAVESGMMDLRRAALLKVARGVTSTEEVFRVIPTEHLLPDG